MRTEPFYGTRPTLELVCRPDDTPENTAGSPWPAATDIRMHIQTFGGLRIFQGDRQVTMTWPSRKSRELLCCILAGSGRKLHRDELIRALWGDITNQGHLNRFKVTMSRIKKGFILSGLPCPVLQEGDFYGIDESITDVDTLIFSARALKGLKLLARTADHTEALPCLEDALDLYSGSFLPEEPHIGFVSANRKMYGQLYISVRNRLENIYITDKRHDALDMLRLIEACQGALGGSLSYRQASGQ